MWLNSINITDRECIDYYQNQIDTLPMTSKLSAMFFGDKKFKQAHYELYQNIKNISDEQVADIFAPYSHSLQQITSQDGTMTLLPLFCEFIRENLRKFHHWEFQKMSSWIELAAHVFQHSFQNNLTKKESFQYFNHVLVRHALFRPPHSVQIFTFQECKQINQHWVGTFLRFYDQYSQCFAPDTNEIINTVCAGFAPQQISKERKQIKRQQFANKFGSVIEVNPAPVGEPKEEGA